MKTKHKKDTIKIRLIDEILLARLARLLDASKKMVNSIKKKDEVWEFLTQKQKAYYFDLWIAVEQSQKDFDKLCERILKRIKGEE